MDNLPGLVRTGSGLERGYVDFDLGSIAEGVRGGSDGERETKGGVGAAGGSERSSEEPLRRVSEVVLMTRGPGKRPVVVCETSRIDSGTPGEEMI